MVQVSTCIKKKKEFLYYILMCTAISFYISAKSNSMPEFTYIISVFVCDKYKLSHDRIVVLWTKIVHVQRDEICIFICVCEVSSSSHLQGCQKHISLFRCNFSYFEKYKDNSNYILISILSFFFVYVKLNKI